MINNFLFYCSKCKKYNPPYEELCDIGGIYWKCMNCKNDIYPTFMDIKKIRKLKIKQINENK